MVNSRLTNYLVIIFGALACLIFIFCYMPHGNSIGAIDYIQYWSALRIIIEGQNPYDPQIMQAMQTSLGKPENATVMSWNPPWTYLILAPFCLLPFQYAVPLWILTNVFFLIHSIALCHKTYGTSTKSSSAKLILYSFYFLPAFSCMAFGQTGLFMSWIICLFLYLSKIQKFLFAGILLSCLSIKPHLFYLLAPFIIYWSFKEKNLRLILGILLGLSFLFTSTASITDGVFFYWLDAILDPSKIQGAQTILDWKVATLVGMIKTIVNEIWLIVPKWPMWLVPLTTATAYLFYLLIKKPKLSLYKDTPPVLALSIFTAPYGWFFDQSILLCLYAFLMLKALEMKSKKLIYVLLALQLVLLVWKATPLNAQHHYFWFPLALLAVYWSAQDLRYDQENGNLKQLSPRSLNNPKPKRN